MIKMNGAMLARGIVVTVVILITQACATTPSLDTTNIDLALTPEEAVTHAQQLQGHRVLWGGMIISAANLKSKTQIEILAYPLDSNQRPDTSRQAYGRFLAQHEGYLETAELNDGRLITLTGGLDGTSTAMIGESRYTYPVIEINEYHLWRRGDEPDSQVHFGLGVMLHN